MMMTMMMMIMMMMMMMMMMTTTTMMMMMIMMMMIKRKPREEEEEEEEEEKQGETRTIPKYPRTVLSDIPGRQSHRNVVNAGFCVGEKYGLKALQTVKPFSGLPVFRESTGVGA